MIETMRWPASWAEARSGVLMMREGKSTLIAPMAISAALHVSVLLLLVVSFHASGSQAVSKSLESEVLFVELPTQAQGAESQKPRPFERPRAWTRPKVKRVIVASALETVVDPTKKGVTETPSPAATEIANHGHESQAGNDGADSSHLSQLAHPGGTNASYFGGLLARLQARRHYPEDAERRGEEGLVEVAFRLTRDGGIHDARIQSASPHSALNEAALETVRRLKRYRALPESVARSEMTIVVPFVFKIRE